jgi:hypothetical protein
MRTPDEIRAMIDRLDENIREHGIDASVNAAQHALDWALGGAAGPKLFDLWMQRPEDERRREWIARGGDPQHWPATNSARP